VAEFFCKANPIIVLKAGGNLSFAFGERVKIAQQFALSKSFCFLVLWNARRSTG